MAEESNFLPHSLIADLKYDVEALKRNYPNRIQKLMSLFWK